MEKSPHPKVEDSIIGSEDSLIKNCNALSMERDIIDMTEHNRMSEFSSLACSCKNCNQLSQASLVQKFQTFKTGKRTPKILLF